MRRRASGKSSSSAAICASAVTMPWPSSTLPVQTVALPSGADADPGVEHAVVGEAAGQRRGLLRERRLGTSRGASVKATTMPPRPAANSRREIAFIRSSRIAWAAFKHRADDAVMGAATAEILGEPLPHIAPRSGCGLRSSSAFADMIMPAMQ